MSSRKTIYRWNMGNLCKNTERNRNVWISRLQDGCGLGRPENGTGLYCLSNSFSLLHPPFSTTLCYLYPVLPSQYSSSELYFLIYLVCKWPQMAPLSSTLYVHWHLQLTRNLPLNLLFQFLGQEDFVWPRSSFWTRAHRSWVWTANDSLPLGQVSTLAQSIVTPPN